MLTFVENSHKFLTFNRYATNYYLQYAYSEVISIQIPPLSFSWEFVSWYVCALTYDREPYLTLWQL